MARQILGKVVPTGEDTYDNNRTYDELCIVMYNGQSYISKKETRGNKPDNTEFWQQLVEKPVKGTDYFTEADKDEMVNDVTNDATNKYNQAVTTGIETFNQNAEQKTSDFNDNASEKTDTYNANVDSTTQAFTDNANSKTEVYNTNAAEKLNTYNSNHTAKLKEYNDNATSKLSAYNTNTVAKTTEYNSNHTSKINAYNSNASNKVDMYDNNADTRLQEYNDNADDKIAEYNEHSEELNNKIVSTRNELERVKNDVLETGENTDTYIHLEDSAMAELQELSVDGVCEQESISGKNLFPNNITTKTINGITITKNKDNSLKLNGTATSDIKLYLVENMPISAGDYTISRGINEVVGFAFYVGSVIFPYTANYMLKNFTISEDTTISSYIYIPTNLQVNVTIYPMLVKGTYTPETLPPYEPYTGEQPSPNPDYPQEIKTITGNLKITSCRKNIYNILNWKNNPPEIAGNGSISVDNDAVTIKTISSSDIYTISGTNIVGVTITQGLAYIVPVKPNTRYTLAYKLNISTEEPEQSSYISELTASHTILSLKNISVNYRSIGAGTFQYYLNISSNEKTNFIGLRLGVHNDVDGSVYKWYDIMLLEGTYNFDNIPSYEEYVESQIQAKLPENEFIGKLSNICKDTLRAEYFPEEGQYHLMLDKMVGKKVFSSDDNWNRQNNENNTVRFSLSNNQYNPYDYYESRAPNFKSNYFIPTSFAQVYRGKSGISWYATEDKSRSNWILSFGDNRTLLEFKNWLSNNPVEAYYPLTTPYTLDLGVIDMPMSYKDITNIFTDSVLLPTINAKYYRVFDKTIQNAQINEKTLKQEITDLNATVSALDTRLKALETKSVEEPTESEETV